MCLITEHVKALQTVKALETQIADSELENFKLLLQISDLKAQVTELQVATPIPIPESETIEMSRQDFVDKMKTLGIEALAPLNPMDSVVRLASKFELDRIAPELVYPAEWCINDLWDCEDYGCQAMLDAGHKFEVTVRLGLGQMELGYHGFAITLDRDLNLWILEPNSGFPYAGEWFKYGENTYHPDKVFI